MAKRRRSTVKVPIRFRLGDITVEYVSRAEDQVWNEYCRVRNAVLDATRILNLLKRIRHPVLVTARVQLAHVLDDVQEDAELDVVAAEIARLSYVMDDTVTVLAGLKHCRVPHLQAARFALTYGQTPKKRDPAGDYGQRDTTDDSTPTPPEPEAGEPESEPVETADLSGDPGPG
jgi:hypothetical protein